MEDDNEKSDPIFDPASAPWVDVEALYERGELDERLREEFPRAAAVWEQGIDRRRFLSAMAAPFALAGVTGCSREPQEKILPYVEMPEHMTQGLPQFYATAMPLDADATGLLAEANMGRPTKLEGNPRHPENRGGTDVFAQAAVLELWDPDRSRSVRQRGEPASWEAAQQALFNRLDQLGPEGEGLCLLTGAITSPSLADQIEQIQARYPAARWYRHVPLEGNVQSRSGTAIPHYHIAGAHVVVSLEADLLSFMPGHLRHAREFVSRRRPDAKPPGMSRWYALESVPTLTGAVADHRLPVRASALPALAAQLAAALGLQEAGTQSPASHADWIRRLADDLREHPGRSLVVAGENQPPEVHALAHRINRHLGNVGRTVSYTEPVDYSVTRADPLAELSKAMHAGRVDTLLMIDTNPVYSAPYDIDFAGGLKRVPFTLHQGLYFDETARRSQWHVPLAHFLEAWGDCRSHDGTVTIRQPVIAPVYGGRSPYELLGTLLARLEQTSREAVRGYWRQRYGESFESEWPKALRSGVAGRSELTERQPPATEQGKTTAHRGAADGERWEIVFLPDRSVWDGRFANVSWLQEFPDPLTRLTWGNAVLIGPGDARHLGIKSGDGLDVSHAGQRISGPALVLPGVAKRTLGLPLGYGREAAGRVGNGVGFNAYRLRRSDSPWLITGVSVAKNGTYTDLAVVQGHHRMEGRDLVKHATLDTFRRNPDFAKPEKGEQQPSLYPPYRYEQNRWGMSIDLNACIGCGACVVACQSENNIPVVGEQQVRLGREMHWLRIDRYYVGPPQKPQTLFQPVPCMQCELAPCEPVCPVEASVHDFEGINVQVYNRCIGTRFCSNNCPYKVRRFNFLQYSKDVPALSAQHNPQVTVRMRGVMEKCNYCLQRIANGRALAKVRGRPLEEGDVRTACQTACPTGAIVFGDLNDPQSEVSEKKASPRDYDLLHEEGTRPRTSYAAKVTHPNPKLE